MGMPAPAREGWDSEGDVPRGLWGWEPVVTCQQASPGTGSFAGADSASFIACAWQVIACLEVQGVPMEPQGGQARQRVLW